jgi:hypothetical protein
MLSISIQDLQPNSQDTSAFYLANIYQLLSKEDGSQVVIPPSLSDPAASFTAPASAVWVNSLWISSLVIGLTCALQATLLQQWARRYLRVTRPQYSPRKRARIRQFFAEGAQRLRLPWTVEVLTTLLHIALFCFFAGLGVFLFNVHPTVFKVAIVWVGLGIISYAYISVLPILHKDSPYHAPLSTLIWFCVICVRYSFFPLATRDIAHRHHITMPGSFVASEDRDQSPLSQDLLMRAEVYASKLSDEIDYRAFSWTIDTIVEDRELEQFFEGVPGFYNSTRNAADIPDFLTNKDKLSNALTGLMDHTLSSRFVPESVKQRRITICTKAISAANLFGPWWLLPRVLFGEWQAFLRSIDFGLFLKDWVRVNRPIPTYYAQCAVALVISSVQTQARDGRWVQLITRQINVSKSVLRRYLTHGDSILLANLIYIVRQTLQIGSDKGEHCEAFIKNASSRTLGSMCQLDAQNSLPELQHDFCILWNELVHAARHGEHTYVRNISLATLKNIRKVYIALHESAHALPTVFAKIDDSDAALDDIDSYPICTIDSRGSALPSASPYLQGQASNTTQLSVSLPVASLPSPVVTLAAAMTFPTSSPSPPVQSTSQVFPVQGAQSTDHRTTPDNHSRLQAATQLDP